MLRSSKFQILFWSLQCRLSLAGCKPSISPKFRWYPAKRALPAMVSMADRALLAGYHPNVLYSTADGHWTSMSTKHLHLNIMAANLRITFSNVFLGKKLLHFDYFHSNWPKFDPKFPTDNVSTVSGNGFMLNRWQDITDWWWYSSLMHICLQHGSHRCWWIKTKDFSRTFPGPNLRL